MSGIMYCSVIHSLFVRIFTTTSVESKLGIVKINQNCVFILPSSANGPFLIADYIIIILLLSVTTIIITGTASNSLLLRMFRTFVRTHTHSR